MMLLAQKNFSLKNEKWFYAKSMRVELARLADQRKNTF